MSLTKTVPGRASVRALIALLPALILPALILAALILPAQVQAQSPGLAQADRPRLAVIVPRVEPDAGDYAALAETLADAMTLTIRLAGLHEVRPRPTPRTAPAEISAVAEYAREQDLDYVIFGEIGRSTEGGTNTVLRLYSVEAGRVTLTRATITGADAGTAATIAAADRLATEFLTSLTGDTVSWGRVELSNQAARPGEYLVYVDGTVAGRNVATLDRIPLGERLIEVVALDGPRAREVIASRQIRLEARAPGRVSFNHSGTGEIPSPEAPLSPDAPRTVATDRPPDPDPAPDAAPDPDATPDPEFSRIGTFLGFRLGYGFAWLGGEGYRDTLGSDRWDSPVGDPALSLVLEQGLTERFALGFDFSVGLRGGKTVVRDDLFGNIQYEVNADVFSLGFYLKPRTAGDRTSMYFLLGPQLVLIEEKPKVEVKSDLFSDSFGLDPDDDVLFGVVLGVGGDVPVGRRALFFADMLYTRTITSFYKTSNWYFNAITVGAGIKFRS